MKKKNVKSLKLNRSKIANLKMKSIQGGTGVDGLIESVDICEEDANPQNGSNISCFCSLNGTCRVTHKC